MRGVGFVATTSQAVNEKGKKMKEKECEAWDSNPKPLNFERIKNENERNAYSPSFKLRKR